MTIANRLGDLPVSTLAATPQAVGGGKVWLVLSCALIADRPAIPSLIGFWIVAVAVLVLCSARLAVGAAVAGHAFSALGVYAAIAAARLVDPSAFSSVVRTADYGLSAIIAAWLGAIAAILWRRHPAAAQRLLIVLGSVGCAGIGLAFRPDVTFLDTEHLLAYAIGVALAGWTARLQATSLSRRLVAQAPSVLAPGRGS